ncbi:MAG: heme exporter protein CcmB [Bacteroidia bacterium]|nr:heme exporter protein CcmB [Bacteroidia bacterium]MDW8346627.1 heme exporter protein CcmB [Bacteroidia bacterium]
MNVKHIQLLLQKEWRTEWRKKTALYSVLLYVFCTTFILYLAIKQIHPVLWNALFWILMLFNALQIISKTFLQEDYSIHLFLYTQVSPLSFILSKMIYNTFMTVVIGGLNFGFYALIMGNPVQDTFIFGINLGLGSAALAVVLTFIASLTHFSTANHSGLIAILGLPVFVPLLTVLIKISKNAMDGLERSLSYPHFLTLSAMIITFLGVSVLLFPQIWKE